MFQFTHRRRLRFTGLPQLAACSAMVAALLGAPDVVDAGGRASAIILNHDATGTTIVKPLPDGSTFQVQNSWISNAVNGIQSFPGDTYAFVNCLPQQRTATNMTLGCSVYDQSTGQWQPPIVTTVDNAFLNADLVNHYNSLFELPGDYVTFTQIEGASTSYSLRVLDVAQATAGFPFFVVQTNPATRQAFLLRNTDPTSGTTESTNFTLGIQTEDYCIDFDVTPVSPGHALSGTYGARRRNDDGSCGEQLFSHRSSSIIPVGSEGEAGTYCRYRVTSVESCTPGNAIVAGAPLCLACAGSCRSYADGISKVLVALGNDYAFCEKVEVELDAGAACSRSCDATKVMFLIPGSE